MATTEYEKFEMITIKELCDMLNISKAYAYHFIKDNKVKHIRIGRRFYIKKSSVESILRMEG